MMFPKENKSPYYIYAPPYRSISAGIKSLYLLCHHLNSKGESAYIYLDRSNKCYVNELDSFFYNLNIRFLDNNAIRFHKNNGYSPIVVYSDTVDGNPINASNIVRYMMNYDGVLKEINKTKNEVNFGYSKNISDSIGMGDDRVLFIPASDPDLFCPPKHDIKREGSCVYLGKYHDYHKGKEIKLTKSSTKIGRVVGQDLPRESVIKLLQSSELCYVYENTAVALEAVLCYCPVVFIPNQFLKESEVHLSRNELGIDGFALNTSEEEVLRAKATVTKGRENYLKSIELFQDQLDNFIKVTQESFHEKEGGDISEIKSFDLYLTKDTFELVTNEEDFNNSVSLFREIFYSNKLSKKIKLLNSNRRVVIETRLKIKEGNIGRNIKNTLKNIFNLRSKNHG